MLQEEEETGVKLRLLRLSVELEGVIVVVVTVTDERECPPEHGITCLEEVSSLVGLVALLLAESEGCSSNICKNTPKKSVVMIALPYTKNLYTKHFYAILKPFYSIL